MLKPIIYKGKYIELLDQTKLPHKIEYIKVNSAEMARCAIADMVIRGAPAIGIVAAYGMAYAAYMSTASSVKRVIEELVSVKNYLDTARPTAVNLMHATEHMLSFAQAYDGIYVDELCEAMLTEANRLHKQDAAINKAIGENALKILKPGCNILTHCNAGVLATSKYGTALSPIYLGQETEISFKVYVDETRPRLQGMQLTAFELIKSNVDVTVICDSAAASLMAKGEIDAILVGADRIAANGDTANKVGTLMLSVLAQHYGVPMYVLAPTSTIDMDCPSGDKIVIEERDEREILNLSAQRIAPEGVHAYNPAFDVTPRENITAIITEKGFFE